MGGYKQLPDGMAADVAPLSPLAGQHRA